ncbi:MAG TPA: gamma carbonic anhydrase family protein [Aliidongia sp.]|uniref:gamma carbonic anhydrase family protein n=1 Tax=Aliidongia sp. TaxID=1914230 RepID=UPI002DDCBE71|nr:gamma carbonic anhydrase family protein [Aliidongia sp.]HEV2674522.1 gamma carbonic anhydrase family protein [Aliidongia sp.]
MLIAHDGVGPRIDPSAWVAPDATVCGDVVIGPGARILHGARLVGEAGGAIRIGRNCIVMENAVVRASRRHTCTIGDHCLIGPNAHIAGAVLEDEVFIATGAAVFHGAHLGRRAEVRIHATVHLRTRLAPGVTVPIGWIAVGDPARILSPDRHDEIAALQAPLNFPLWVYGFDRTEPDLMVQVTRRLSEALGTHAADLAIQAPGDIDDDRTRSGDSAALTPSP